jgi:hypothetical protein
MSHFVKIRRLLLSPLRSVPSTAPWTAWLVRIPFERLTDAKEKYMTLNLLTYLVQQSTEVEVIETNTISKRTDNLAPFCPWCWHQVSDGLCLINAVQPDSSAYHNTSNTLTKNINEQTAMLDAEFCFNEKWTGLLPFLCSIYRM